MIFMELIGSAAAPTLDQSSQGVTGSPFLSGSTPNTTVANEMLVGFCGASDPWADPTTYAESGATPSGTWTFQDQINSGTNGTIGYYCAMATSPIAAIGSYQWSFTEFSASAAASHIATFYEPGGGGPSSDLLMGQACL